MITLEELDTEFGRITIVRSEAGDVTSYFQDSCLQSRMAEGGVSVLAYAHIMHGILRQIKARRVLIIGCAGGTLATMLHKDGCIVTVVDVNPHAFILARKYFAMPDAVECITWDGFAYLQQAQRRFDAVILDAFDSKVRVPESLMTEACFNAVRNRLVAEGVVLMNVVLADDADGTANIIARNMRSSGLPAMLFDWPGLRERNCVIAGGAVESIHFKAHALPKFIHEKIEGLIQRRAAD